MPTPPEEIHLVHFLGRTFPALASLSSQDGHRRAEALGVFAATLVAQGALASRGLALPPEVQDAVSADAYRIAQTRQGGVAFLARVRALLQDPRFAPWVATAAQVFRATSGAGGTQIAMATAPPRELGGFELVAQLGEGAMGKVFKARQKSLDRLVALKVLSHKLALDADYVARFHSEAKAAAKLSHPSVVSVIDQGTDAATGVHYIAFELIDGQTLEDVLRVQRRLPERDALAIARALADGLSAAEQAGIVHRDVKPENIIISRDGMAKLVDLGLAKRRDEQKETSSAGVVIGTPAYMSPEQAMGRADIDHRADLYALGMTLFRMLTGRLAYEGDTATAYLFKHVQERCPDPRTFDPAISENAARVVLKLCAREREARYANAAEAVKDLDLVLAGRAPIFAAEILPSTESRGTVTRSTGRFATGGGVPDEPRWADELLPPGIPDSGLAPPTSPDAAEALLQALERSGDPEQIARAMEQLQHLVADAASQTAVAKAEAALARAFLLRGDRANAEQRAQGALERDPRCRPALEVLARAARGDADRCRLEANLAQVRFYVLRGQLDDARALADALREAFPHEPQPFLALTAIAKLRKSDADFVDSLRRAWSVYPSRERGNVWLGGLDGLVCDLLVAQGRTAYRGDGSLLKQTVEGLDDKSNLIAGALRMAIGVARVALERGGLTLFEQRRLHFAQARALSSLRRYDAALDEIARATQFHPSEVERESFEAERAFVNYMRNMDQGARPGPQPRYRCLGALSLLDLARSRMALAMKEKAARAFDLEKVGLAVAALAGRDPRAKSELKAAAEKAGDREPFALLEPAEQELAEIARERASPLKEAARPAAGQTGFFGKLKGMADAAAAGVAGAAREAQLKLREAQANARYESAAKRFAGRFGRDLAGYAYSHGELARLARDAARLATSVEVFADEETRSKKDAERLATLV